MKKNKISGKTVLEIVVSPYGDLVIKIGDYAFGSTDERNELKTSLIHILENSLKIDFCSKGTTKAIKKAIDELTFVDEVVD